MTEDPKYPIGYSVQCYALSSTVFFSGSQVMRWLGFTARLGEVIGSQLSLKWTEDERPFWTSREKRYDMVIA